MRDPDALSWLVCSLLAALPVAVLFAAIILRAACSICRVPAPRFGKAVGVVVVASLASGLAVGLLALFLGLLAARGGAQAQQAVERATAVGQVAGLAVVILITCSVYAHFLRITLGRAFLVRLVETAIAGAIGLVAGGVVILILWATRTAFATLP
jgi:hypothetical protein